MLVLTGGAWTVVLATILTHTIFVTNDSISNYIHVWYVADRFWHGHGVPLYMPVLGHGDAFAFPYGFIPWFGAALLRPIFGDWIVTLWLVVGFVGVVVAQWWAFPELRRGWWSSILLVNPMLVEAPLLGQLPFLWATAILIAAVGCWRHDRRLVAALLMGAAQATHPAVILPIAGLLVLVWLYLEPYRRALLGWYALSLLIAMPAVWIVLASPSVGDVSTGTLLKTFFGTVILRALVVGAPFIGIAMMRTPLVRIQPLMFAGLIALTVALIPVRHNEYAVRALTRTPDQALTPFVRSSNFVPGATYRILRVGDGKVGMYDLVKAGGLLDSEPFPESIDRRSFATSSEYVAFLVKRHVDYVLIYDAYDARYGTNEHRLLKEMAEGSSQTCASVAAAGDGYEVYRVAHNAACDRSSEISPRRPVHAAADLRKSTRDTGVGLYVQHGRRR